jgi:hypothetical protein
LAVVGAGRGGENLRLLNAWATAEGGSATWNPLNTTYPLAWGSTSYNSSQVKNYYRPTAGVCATALTLIDARYAGILGDLQSGTKTAEQICIDNTAEFSTWGTGSKLILKVLASS